MTQEVNPKSSEITCSTPQIKHSKEPGYIYDSVRKRWVADIRDGKRVCTVCRERKPLDDFSGNKQKMRTCRECRRYIKANQRYGISFEQAKELYSHTTCQCCGQKFDTEKYQSCIHHIENGSDTIVRGIVCKECNWLLRDESKEHLIRLKACANFVDEDMIRSA